MTDAKHRLEGFVERELDVAGARLRYAVAGEGPPLLLVHGLGGTIENWRALAPALAARHRVVVPDLPGHGHSAPLAGTPGIDTFADAVLAVAEEEGAAPAVWVGHSLGGLLGLRAAALRPEAVRGLVLAAAAGPSSTSRSAHVALTSLGLIQPGKLIAPFRRSWSRSRTGRYAAFGWWGVADTDALEPELAEAFLVGPAHHTNTGQAGRALLGSDPRAELEHISCPLLLLWGASDKWVPLADGMEYARRLHAPLRAIAGCGHLLIGERPEACLAAIDEFVDSLDADPLDVA